MSLFEKKVPVFRKRDRDTQGRIREALDAAGIWNRCSHFEQEEIDREVYVVYVRASDEERALRAIRDAGLVTEVRTAKELTSEAADKIRDRKY